MFLELAEALDCPICRSSVGLVAFATKTQDRRVIQGWLGCPLCELEFPIDGGSIDFSEIAGPAMATEVESDGNVSFGSGECLSPTVPLQWAKSPSDQVVRLAAMLGLGGRDGMVLLLGPGLSNSAVQLTKLAERIEVLCWFDSRKSAQSIMTLEELVTGVNPMIGALVGSWPFRTGSLDGIALLSPAVSDLPEVERCAGQGARLVVINPTEDDVVTLEERGFSGVAHDNSTWVGERN
jgi:uncharacterized protein YbaR (Trm112 family)